MRADAIETLNAADIGWIARPGVIPENDTECDGSLFPSGERAVICTSWAGYVRRAHGDRAKLFGFMFEDNPQATGLAELAEGHDFAVIDDRWIVDGWLADVEAVRDDPVIDMHDQREWDFVRRFYGDPACWTRMEDIEREIDAESPERRAECMAGITPKDALLAVNDSTRPHEPEIGI